MRQTSLVDSGTIDVQQGHLMMTDHAGDIEVGQVADPAIEGGGGLRLWRAREAMRQAELRLSAQAAALATIESRAQALAGWLTSALTVLVSAFLVPTLPLEARGAAIGGAVTAAIALSLLVMALRPSDWTVAGHDPVELLSSPNSTELNDLEEMTRAYAGGIVANASRLATTSTLFRRALWAAMCVPLTSLAAGALVWAVRAAPSVQAGA